MTLLPQKNKEFIYPISFKMWTSFISGPPAKLTYLRFKKTFPPTLLQCQSISIKQVLQLLFLHSFLVGTIMGHSHTNTHMGLSQWGETIHAKMEDFFLLCTFHMFLNLMEPRVKKLKFKFRKNGFENMVSDKRKMIYWQ